MLVTYDITRLMRLTGPQRFLVTLGGRDRVDPATVLAEMTYDHPLYTPESVAAQRLSTELDDDRLVFAGAYHGWGFHEDGAASGLRAAQRLGADWPSGGPGDRCRHADPRHLPHPHHHLRRAPVHHYFEHGATAGTSTSTSCPSCRVAAAVRPVRCRATTLDGSRRTTTRCAQRVDAFLADHGIDLPAAPSPRCCRPGCSATCSTR